MAKDYFQDIVPPNQDGPRPEPLTPEPQSQSETEPTSIPIQTRPAAAGVDNTRSIRNIAPSPRVRPRTFEPHAPQDMGDLPPVRRKGTVGRYIIWMMALLAVLAVAALVFVALRPTKVFVVPRTHALNFSQEQFIAYPDSSAALGALTYSVESIELEDSEVVESQGTVYAEDKATGNITVYNNFQTTPLTLVKNTRFETSSGLVFRTPAEIVIPGKQGSTPGKVVITVVADQPGAQYNVAAGKFTLPGLKNNAQMFAQVYAESTEAFSGGFVGERPGVAPGALESAISAVRARLQQKIVESTAQFGENVVALPELIQIEYQSMPNTTEAGGGVRIHQQARASVPVFPSALFAAAVSGSAVSAEDTSSISLVQGDGFMSTMTGTSTVLGVTPVSFALSGSATLVWEVPVEEIRLALVGKDKEAFEAIAQGFPSVEEARAHIQPFWKSTFPTKPEDIKVVIEEATKTE